MKRKAETLDAVRRASARSASLVHGEMKQGLNGLASIAASAPLVGLFSTVVGIYSSLSGGSAEKSSFMNAIAKSLSESLAPTALSLVVALLSSCFYKYLLAWLKNFDIEIKNASLELIDELARL